MSTQVSIRRPATESGIRPHVVVGVDAASQSTGAVLWACEEAGRLRLPLRLVAAYPDVVSLGAAASELSIVPDVQEATRETMRTLASRLSAEADLLPVDVRSGHPRRVLLDTVEAGAAMLVVGHRGLGAARRVLSGSTSIAVAGRSPVPVVVVPDSWVPAGRSSAPVVVGVEPGPGAATGTDAEVMRFAFDRAQRLRVPLVVVHAYDVPALLTWSPDDVRDHGHHVSSLLHTFLAPWRSDYPTVEISARAVAGRPVEAVLDAARVAQLTVVGRHTSASRPGGLRLGSTARGVLHHAVCPVAVIPVSGRHGGYDSPSVHSDVWAPMF